MRGSEAEIGTEVETQNGYINVKTEDGWRYKHAIIAEEKLGRPIEKGERVRFKDGNRRNFDPSNIEVYAVKEPTDPVKKLRARVLRWQQEGVYILEELDKLTSDNSESSDSQSESN